MIVRVHLPTWVLDDGAVAPFGLGDHVELGLGIAVEQLPLEATADEADGITSLPTPGEWGRVRAWADVVGPTRPVPGADGRPFATLVMPLPGVPLVIMGPDGVDPGWSRMLVRGDVLIEPYLWGEGGLFRAAVPRFRGAVVERIQTPLGAMFVDVPRTVAHRVDGLDYLVDLRFDPPSVTTDG